MKHDIEKLYSNTPDVKDTNKRSSLFETLGAYSVLGGTIVLHTVDDPRLKAVGLLVSGSAILFPAAQGAVQALQSRFSSEQRISIKDQS